MSSSKELESFNCRSSLNYLLFCRQYHVYVSTIINEKNRYRYQSMQNQTYGLITKQNLRPTNRSCPSNTVDSISVLYGIHIFMDCVTIVLTTV